VVGVLYLPFFFCFFFCFLLVAVARANSINQQFQTLFFWFYGSRVQCLRKNAKVLERWFPGSPQIFPHFRKLPKVPRENSWEHGSERPFFSLQAHPHGGLNENTRTRGTLGNSITAILNTNRVLLKWNAANLF
jgi:hypothetical protein